MLERIKELFCNRHESCSEEMEEDETFYHTIPLFAKEEMESAEIAIDKEFIYNLYRQILNGYAGYYQDKWLVGTAEGGVIKKVGYDVYSKHYGKSSLNEAIDRIDKTQSKAKYGKELKMNNDRYCKLSYDLKDQMIFATHVTLMKEYTENEVYKDTGTYGGIHFGSLKHFEDCLDFQYTSYGNKLIMIQPIDDSVYYNYMSNVYVGNKVYVEKVLYLDDPATWKYLNNLDDGLMKRKNHEILAYLQNLAELDNERSYHAAISYVTSMVSVNDIPA